jgi:hypothetical protein
MTVRPSKMSEFICWAVSLVSTDLLQVWIVEQLHFLNPPQLKDFIFAQEPRLQTPIPWMASNSSREQLPQTQLIPLTTGLSAP